MGEAKRRKLAGDYPTKRSLEDRWARYFSNEDTLAYTEAADYVRREKRPVYAFVPEKNAGRVIGGTIWMIEYEPDHETDPDEWDVLSVYFARSEFGSSVGEEEWYMIPEAEPDLSTLCFRTTTVASREISFYQLDVALRMLEGASKDEALREF